MTTIDYQQILRQAKTTHSQEYPASYYAASREHTNNYPTLKDKLKVDVCVIGGGFSGINTALELAEKNYSVAVLEARKIGWGASGRSGGQLIIGTGHNIHRFRKILSKQETQQLVEMGFESVEIVKQRIHKYQLKCDLKPGTTDVAKKPRQVDELKEYAEFLTQFDYPHKVTFYDQHQVTNIVNSARYLAALNLSGGAHLHPLNLCLGEAHAASQLGVKIFENSPVIRFSDTTKPHQIDTPKGQIQADFVILCANAYGYNLHPAISAKILPAGSYIIATEPLGDLGAELLAQDTAVCDLNYALDYFRLSADKRLLFGASCKYTLNDPANIVNTVRPRMLSVFPQLKNHRLDYSWGGKIGISINRIPQVGRIKSTLYYAQAYSGHGVNNTHLAAKIIAESIDQQSKRIDIFEKIPHRSFPNNRYLRSSLFSLAVIYYKLRDLL